MHVGSVGNAMSEQNMSCDRDVGSDSKMTMNSNSSGCVTGLIFRINLRDKIESSR